MQPLLPDIEVLTLRATLRSRGSGSLPPLLHSTIRGALGHALRRVADQPDELGSSPYARVFDGTPYPDRATGLRREIRSTPPPPFLVRCAISGTPAKPRRRKVGPGDELRFGLTLLGFACDELRHVSLAIEDAAAQGLGEDRIPFELVGVQCMSSAGPVPLNLSAPARPVGPSLRLLESASPLPNLRIRTLTPLQLRSKGEILTRPEAVPFLRAVQRRLLTLENACAAFPREEAPRVPTNSEILWRSIQSARLERLSSRQRRKIRLDGIIGDAEFTSDNKPFVQALLMAGAVVGLGHGTTQGCGHITVPGAEPLLACFGVVDP